MNKIRGQAYYIVQSIGDDLWMAFAIWCILHNHPIMGGILAALIVLGASARNTKLDRWEGRS